MCDAAKDKTTTTKAPSGKKLCSEELRSVYRSWLKDLQDDKPAKLLRKLDKKKFGDGNGAARRSLGWRRRLQQAQQPTAASALKDAERRKDERAKLPALEPLRLTPEAKEALLDAQRRRHEALVQEATFAAVQYPLQRAWRPGLAFFQQLVDHALLKPAASDDAFSASTSVRTDELANFPVRLAPILVRVHVGTPSQGKLRRRHGVALFFCLEKKEQSLRLGLSTSLVAAGDDASLALQIHVYSSSRAWMEHREALLQKICNLSGEIRAVWKEADDLECRSSALRLLRSPQDVTRALDELWPTAVNDEGAADTADSHLCAIQQFVPCKGTANTSSESSSARRAWIARCCFRKRDRNASTVWIISGGTSGDDKASASALVTNSGGADCQLVKCSGNQAWSEPRLVASTCALALGNALSVAFNELVVDLLQDDAGGWWMLQIKAFELSRARPSSTATRAGRALTGAGDLSRSQSAPTDLERAVPTTPSWKKWRCAGRFCADRTVSLATGPPHGENDLEDDKEPRGYLTKKVLRSCEFFEDFVRQQDVSLAGGFSELPGALAFHLQHRLPKRDRSQLYEPQPLCYACVCRYHALRQEWMQTVTAPRTVLPASSAGAGATKRLARARNHVASADQVHSMPRKLRALQPTTTASPGINASVSTPVLPGVSSAATVSSRSVTTDKSKKRPSYLDDLTAMEQMLAQHDPESMQSRSKTPGSSLYSQGLGAQSTELSQPLSPSSGQCTDLFREQDDVRRIEDMWQSFALQPLGELDGSRSNNSDKNGESRRTYNSFSLQQAMTKLSNTPSDSSNENQQTLLQETSQDVVQTKNRASPRATRFKPEAVCRFRIQHCRHVFEDEMYREQIVSDVVDAFCSGECGVCLVIDPTEPVGENSSSGKRCHEGAGQESELAEMALRSLYLDVKGALPAALEQSQETPAASSISSWPLRPAICREASGCVTMMLGPS